MTIPPPALLEAAVYGPDLDALERFYTEVMGLPVILRADGRLVALRAGHATLLLFDPAVTREAGGMVPAHGGSGAGHVAFVIEDEACDAWRRRLAEHAVAVEKEVAWPEGGVSLYVRDPAGNSVELAPPRIWGGLGRDLLDALRAHPAPAP
jgi:catechol 2,3-dioxygenase-like lactoylglutathione lyase family enzyme